MNATKIELENMPAALEQLIDSHGIQAVLSSLEEICYGKAQHIEENWQDLKTARAWHNMGDAISKAWSKAGDLGL